MSSATGNRFNRMWELIRQIPHSTYQPEIPNAPKPVQDSAPDFCRLACLRCGMEAEMFLLQRPPIADGGSSMQPAPQSGSEEKEKGAAAPPVLQAEPDVERAKAWLISQNLQNKLHPSQDSCVTSLAAEFAAISQEAERAAFEKAAKICDSVDTSDRLSSCYASDLAQSIRALASRDAKPESEGDEKC